MSVPSELTHFVSAAIKGLSDDTDSVSVSASLAEKDAVFVAVCAKTDLAKVIGTRGAHINAVRTLLKAMAAKHRLKAVLMLRE